MDIFARMLTTQALLFLFILLGVVVYKARIITAASRGSFNLFLIKVTLPAMILHSFLGDVSLHQLANAGLMLLVSLTVCLLSWLAGRFLWRRQPGPRKAPLVFGTMFSNAGNAGLPVVELVFGASGVFYASIFLIPVRILMWTLGLGLFLKEKGPQRWKKLLLTPSVVVVFLGLLLLVTGIKLPFLFSNAIKRVGDITGPLSMILIGTTLAEFPFKEAFCKEAWLLSGVRLLLIPILVLGVLMLFQVDSSARAIAFVLCAMPVATTTVVFSERHQADYHLASKCVFLSTVLSLITVPLLTLLL